MPRDSKQRCRFYDISTFVECMLTKGTFSFGKAKGFEHDRHTVRLEQFLIPDT